MTDLVADYMRDLEIEIETNDRLIPAGRTDLIEYTERCRQELAELQTRRATGRPVYLDRYGMPDLSGKTERERTAEALALIAACVRPS